MLSQNFVINGPVDGLYPNQYQANTWTNVDDSLKFMLPVSVFPMSRVQFLIHKK